MRNGICPKCNSTEIYKKVKGISQGGSGGCASIYTSWITTPTDLESFICTFCGFFESYVIDRNKLNEVAENWEKADKS